LGTGVRVVRANGAITSASGTSLAAPLITSLAAGIWQRFPQLTNKEIIEALKATASKAKNPDILMGYGIPHYSAVVNYLERINQNNIFEVFPNPIVDTVTVRPIDPDSISSCRIELISSIGQLIAEKEVAFTWKDDDYTTDLSQLPSGLYYFRIWLGKQRFVFKLIKQ
jgi:serine protease AprX